MHGQHPDCRTVARVVVLAFLCAGFALRSPSHALAQASPPDKDFPPISGTTYGQKGTDDTIIKPTAFARNWRLKEVIVEVQRLFPASLNEGLVAHWKFDEGHGGVARDSGPNKLDATLMEYADANKAWIAGRFGNGLAFDGKANYVNVPGSEQLLNPGARDWTIAVWVKTTGCDRQGYCQVIVGKRQPDTGQSLVLTVGGPQPGAPHKPHKASFIMDSRGRAVGAEGKTDVCDGRWHHLVGTRKGKTLRIYVDGKLEGELTDNGIPEIIASDSHLRFGMQGVWDGWAAPRFEGVIDDVRIYSRALTDDEIAALASEPP